LSKFRISSGDTAEMAVEVAALVGKLVGLGATSVVVGSAVNVPTGRVCVTAEVDDGVGKDVGEGLVIHPAIRLSITHAKNTMGVNLFCFTGYSPPWVACLGGRHTPLSNAAIAVQISIRTVARHLCEPSSLP
jgi:hypothetical protein